MKLLSKKSASKKSPFTAINKQELNQVKGGVGVLLLDGIESGVTIGEDGT